MKRCTNCNRVYEDKEFAFCPRDGGALFTTGNDESLGSTSSPSILKSGRDILDSGASTFLGKYVEDDVAHDGLELKVFPSDDDDYATIGIKVSVKNLAREKREIDVTVKAYDADGFEIDSWLLSSKVASGHVKVLTSKEELDSDTFESVEEWRIDEVSSYD